MVGTHTQKNIHQLILDCPHLRRYPRTLLSNSDFLSSRSCFVLPVEIVQFSDKLVYGESVFGLLLA